MSFILELGGLCPAHIDRYTSAIRPEHMQSISFAPYSYRTSFSYILLESDTFADPPRTLSGLRYHAKPPPRKLINPLWNRIVSLGDRSFVCK